MASYRSKRRRITQEVNNQLLALHNLTPNLRLPQIELGQSEETCRNIDDEEHFNSLVAEVNLDLPALDFSPSQNQIGSKAPRLSSSLAQWSLNHNITHSALSDLLLTLQPFVNEEIPLCAKTVLKTPQSIKLSQIGGGQFYYFGISDQIKKHFSKIKNLSYFPIVKKNLEKIPETKLITISVSTDGIPICKSSNTQMWPILFRIDQIPNSRPLLAGIFCGESKPLCVNEFLRSFVSELSELEKNGTETNEGLVLVQISCIIADAPARSFVKGTKGHTAYHGCERCEDEGSWSGRMVYSSRSCILRTDERFRNQDDYDHHLKASPFVGLKIGLVSQVVLDYMHLICLGVTRKLFNLWISGPLTTRLPAKGVRKISTYLVEISKLLPNEFARKPRSLRDINRFKATEFRTLLLYTGPCALRGVLPVRQYEHFMSLSCATYILLSKDACHPGWNQIARKLLQSFVLNMQSIYGSTSLVYNVHSLLHVADDALNYGSLDNVSAFPYENFLQRIKKMVRGQKLHLQQVVKRVIEIDGALEEKSISSKRSGPGKIKGNECCKFYAKNTLISNRAGNNCFVGRDGAIVLVQNIYVVGENVSVRIKQFVNSESIKRYPIESELLKIVKLWPRMSDSRIEGVEYLKIKCVLLPYKHESEKFFCIPMLQISD
jgi:hypothetical protein